METVVTFVVEWWRVELGLAVGAVVVSFLWRFGLADLFLSSVELP